MGLRRVVVTGIGIISALGLNKDDFRDGLFKGKSGIDTRSIAELPRLRFKNGAEVRGFDEEEHFDSKQLVMLERFSSANEPIAAGAVC